MLVVNVRKKAIFIKHTTKPQTEQGEGAGKELSSFYGSMLKTFVKTPPTQIS